MDLQASISIATVNDVLYQYDKNGCIVWYGARALLKEGLQENNYCTHVANAISYRIRNPNMGTMCNMVQNYFSNTFVCVLKVWKYQRFKRK